MLAKKMRNNVHDRILSLHSIRIIQLITVDVHILCTLLSVLHTLQPHFDAYCIHCITQFGAYCSHFER